MVLESHNVIEQPDHFLVDNVYTIYKKDGSVYTTKPYTLGSIIPNYIYDIRDELLPHFASPTETVTSLITQIRKECTAIALSKTIKNCQDVKEPNYAHIGDLRRILADLKAIKSYSDVGVTFPPIEV